MARTKTDRNATPAAASRSWQRARQTAQAAKPVAAQMKPLANDTKAAASRGLLRARAWTAPQVHRTGQVLQDTVAPKVAAALHSTAERLDPAKPKRHSWRKAAGISALLAAAGATVAALRRRTAASAPAPADEDEAAPVSDTAAADGEAKKPAHTS
jgi:hypothetical protein